MEIVIVADTNPKLAVISRETLIPLGFALAGLVAVAGGFGYLQNMREEQRLSAAQAHDEIRDVKEDVRALRSDVSRGTDDRWRKSDMKLWAAQFKASNPTAVVPDVQ